MKALLLFALVGCQQIPHATDVETHFDVCELKQDALARVWVRELSKQGATYTYVKENDPCTPMKKQLVKEFQAKGYDVMFSEDKKFPKVCIKLPQADWPGYAWCGLWTQ